MGKRWLTLALAVLLGGCERAPEPVTVTPALWSVADRTGVKGYLFGTIHALPDGVDWRRPAIDRALDDSAVLTVEVADLGNEAAMAEIFARLARTPGLPPLSERIDPELRDELAALSKQAFTGVEDWAATLVLAQSVSAAAGLEAENGVDRALLADAGEMPIAELESADAQLALFDGLPPGDQRAMLNAVVRTAADADEEAARLQDAWSRGDEAALDALTREGMMAEPALRDRLLVARNRAWLPVIERQLRAGDRPFVAVGAAHVAGRDGLAAMLVARGWAVKRMR